MKKSRMFAVVLVVLLAGGGVLAAEPPERPKIGVAFSGGGAKGCAHIGVLRVLEEMRIPIDYAAGTSIGAIVGGLYASGMGPDELTEAIVGIDWADALVDKPPRRDLVFRRKDDDLRYIPDLELGIGRGGLRFPTGLRSGQKLNYLLRRYTLPVRTTRDFDALPTPFRAVATDIATGSAVVLGAGDLARALRASMAIPTVFAAVEIDGKLLVDGGISNNVPVDVVRAMGADVVIAIDIGSPLADEEHVRRSFLAILGQTMGMNTRGNMAPRLADADLVITPEVASYGMLDFERGDEIIAKGEAEARRQAAALAPFALTEEEYRRWQSSRRREGDPIPEVAEVRIEGHHRVDERVLAAQIRLQPGAPFSPEVARDDLARIFGLGDFENVDFELQPSDDGRAAVVYRVKEKSWGPTYLRAGLGFASDGEGRNDLSILAAMNRTRLNDHGAEWKTELQFGPVRFVESAFYQPLSFEKGWFVEPSISYRRSDLPLYTQGERVAELDVVTSRLALDFGYALGRYGEARLGLERSWVTPRRETGMLPDVIEHLSGQTFHRAGVAFELVADRLDSATLPKNGSLGRLTAFHSLEGLGADDRYTRIEVRFSRFWTHERHTLFGNLNGGTSPGGELPVYDGFHLGGFFSLSGFEPFELTGDNYGLVRLGYYFRLVGSLHLGGYFEAARLAPKPSEVLDHPILTATALAVMDTAFGPLYLSLGNAEGGKQSLTILFGRQF